MDRFGQMVECFFTNSVVAVNVPMQSLKTSDIEPVLSKGNPWHWGRFSVWIHTEMRTWDDKKIQLNAAYRSVFTTQLNHLASLTNRLSVRLRTRRLWVQLSMQSLKFQIFRLFRAKVFLDIQGNKGCGFTLKCVCEIIKTNTQMQRTGKYSQDSSMICPVWQKGWDWV